MADSAQEMTDLGKIGEMKGVVSSSTRKFVNLLNSSWGRTKKQHKQTKSCSRRQAHANRIGSESSAKKWGVIVTVDNSQTILHNIQTTTTDTHHNSRSRHIDIKDSVDKKKLTLPLVRQFQVITVTSILIYFPILFSIFLTLPQNVIGTTKRRTPLTQRTNLLPLTYFSAGGKHPRPPVTQPLKSNSQNQNTPPSSAADKNKKTERNIKFKPKRMLWT